MIQVRAARHAPRQMLGDERRLQALDQPPQPLEVRAVDTLDGAERETHPMQGQRILAAQPLQRPDGRAAAHVVLGVDLEPADRGPALEHLRHVGRAQADAAVDGTHRASLDTASGPAGARAAARPRRVPGSC